MKYFKFIYLLIIATFIFPGIGKGERVLNVNKFYISNLGSDDNSCIDPNSPCLNISKTYSKILSNYDFQGRPPTIFLADGVYNDFEFNMVEMPIGAHAVTIEGNCGGKAYGDLRDKVLIKGKPNKTIFWAEDGTTLIINCMKLIGSQSNGIACRQHVIIDADYLNFGELNLGLAANDFCIINVGGNNYISGNMKTFASSNYFSIIRFTGINSIKEKVSIPYFYIAQTKSMIIQAAGSKWINHDKATGISYLVHREGSIYADGVTIPGNKPGENINNSGQYYK